MNYKSYFLDNDPCKSNPCLNNGQCSVSAVTGTYSCTCASGYTGNNCGISNLN